VNSHGSELRDARRHRLHQGAAPGKGTTKKGRGKAERNAASAQGLGGNGGGKGTAWGKTWRAGERGSIHVLAGGRGDCVYGLLGRGKLKVGSFSCGTSLLERVQTSFSLIGKKKITRSKEGRMEIFVGVEERSPEQASIGMRKDARENWRGLRKFPKRYKVARAKYHRPSVKLRSVSEKRRSVGRLNGWKGGGGGRLGGLEKKDKKGRCEPHFLESCRVIGKPQGEFVKVRVLRSQWQ